MRPSQDSNVGSSNVKSGPQRKPDQFLGASLVSSPEIWLDTEGIKLSLKIISPGCYALFGVPAHLGLSQMGNLMDYSEVP